MGWIEYLCLGIGGLMALLTTVLDLRNRTVRLLPLLLLLLAGLFFRGTQFGLQMWGDWAINAGLLLGVILMVWMGLRLLGITGLVNQQIGIGDLIFMLAAGTWLNPFGFALFLSSGLLFVLLIILLMIVFGLQSREMPLPIAGLMAAYLLMFFPLYREFEIAIRLALET